MSLSRRHFLLLSAAAALPARAATIPRPAPDFSIVLPDGSKLPLNKYRGKVVGLTFINTNCPHCHEVTQVLSEIQKEYGAKEIGRASRRETV